ncbi:MAG: biotin transporter BioY [Gemmatimonadales bacterium]
MNTIDSTHQLRMTPNAVVRRSLALVAGSLLVALGAQAAIPLPGTPVPLTLQVPAVLIVGGLLGPQLGAASLAIYLALGAAGLPVFAPVGVPGLARLFGPTGGYLLAYPLAAAVVGRFAVRKRSVATLGVGLLLGLLTIHAGGVAQLAVLGGDVRSAVSLGSLPFLVGDLAKLVVACFIIRRLASKTSALL